MKNRLLFFLMLSSLFISSCSKNKDMEEGSSQDAVSLKASIRHLQSSDAATRIITNNDWFGQEDKRIAVSIDGEVKEYNVDDEGNVTSIAPFYWEGRTELTVNLWYPYNDGVRNENVVVRADQSDNNNFISSDCLEALNVKVSKTNNNVEMTHRTAKVVFRFSMAENGYINKMVYDQLIGVENDSKEVIFNPSNEVLLAPQTILAGQALLKVYMNGRWVDFGTISPDADVELKAGMSHIFNVDVDEAGAISITFQGTMSWDYKEDIMNGNTPELGSDDVVSDWGEGSTGDINGDSPTVGNGGNVSDWGEGSTGDINGNSPTVGNGGDVDDWGEGNGGDINGDSPTVGPNGEGGNWNTGNNDVEGNSPVVGNDGEIGNWTTTDKETQGETPTVGNDGEVNNWTTNTTDLNGNVGNQSTTDDTDNTDNNE